MLTSIPKKEVIYQKVGNEVYVIPVVGNSPSHHFKEAEKPALPHSGETIDENGLRRLRELKSTFLGSPKI